MSFQTESRISKQMGRRYPQGGGIAYYSPLAEILSPPLVVVATWVQNLLVPTIDSALVGWPAFGEGWLIFNASPLPGPLTSLLSSTAAPATGQPTSGIKVGRDQYFGLTALAQSWTGTPQVQITVLQSISNVSTNFVAPDVGATVWKITDSAVHVLPITPSPMPWMQFYAVGLPGNPTDTVLTLAMWMQR
jgi:hypothetical protein